MIEENLSRLRSELPANVKLLAVSKFQPIERLLEAYQAGQRIFGENRALEMRDKHEQLPEDIQWHFIGHLQRNKIKYIVPFVAMIHSVDSVELAAEIQKEAARINKVQDILLEVNVAAEESKFGFRPEEVADAAEQIFRMPNVRLCGLMTVAPYTENPSENRVYFGQLRKLAVDILSKNKDNVSEYCISMGMSNDFEEAVEEGATMVRVGSLIFGERHYEDKTEGSK